MLKVENAPANVIALRLSGIVTEDDIKAVEMLFADKLKGDQKFGLFVDMSQMQDMTSKAIAEDLKFELGMIGKLKRFPKMAVVSDKQWVAALVKFFDPLIPAVDARVFASEAFDEAMTFASELPAPVEPPAPAITMIETDDPKLMAYQIDGSLTKQDVDTVTRILMDAFEKQGKVDLFVRMKAFSGFDPAILAQRSLISMKLAALEHVRRYAVVGAKDWMENMIGVFQPMTSVDIRTFDADQEDDAWAWLKS